MNVADLKAILNVLPDEMEIIEQRYSDYDSMSPSSWTVVKAVSKDGCYYMRSHQTMSKENKANEKEYLYFAGN